MGKVIDVQSLKWYKGEEFLHFAFGDFNTKEYGIYRTSDGNRYTNNLIPNMQDVTADIPGQDGQHYFGTHYRQKAFDITFAFDELTVQQIREIKRALSGNELKELYLFENQEDCAFDTSSKISDIYKGIYMAKVTNQPNIKIIPFENKGGETIYKGEGSVQFTAYWPFSRGSKSQSEPLNLEPEELSGDGSTRESKITRYNLGDIPTYVTITVSPGNPYDLQISKIDFLIGNDIKNTIIGKNITSWNGKTGIVKSEDSTIPYSGDGLYRLEPGENTISFTYKTFEGAYYGKKCSILISYYNWYY